MTVGLIGSCGAVAEKLSVCPRDRRRSNVPLGFCHEKTHSGAVTGRSVTDGIGGSIRSMRRFAPHLTSEQSSIFAGEVEVYLRQHRHDCLHP